MKLSVKNVEKNFEKTEVIPFLKDCMFKKKILWFKKLEDQFQRGVHDFHICKDGRFIALELKASEDHKLSALQKFEGDLIELNQGKFFVAHPQNWEQIKEQILGLPKTW